MKRAGGRVLQLVRGLRDQLSPAEAERIEAAIDQIERGVSLLELTTRESFGEFEHRVRDLSILRRVCDVVVSTFDVDAFGTSLLEILDEEIPSRASALELHEGIGQRPAHRVARGVWSGPGADELSQSCARRALERLAPVRIDDARERSELAAAADAANWRSLLCCPVVALGQPIAAILLCDASPGRFGEGDARAVASVADLVGLALRHLAVSAGAASGLPDPTSPPPRWCELQQDHLALVRREKLASLAALAGSVAHEINNPMSYVLSNLGRAREYVESLEETFRSEVEDPSDKVAPLFEDFHGLLDETVHGLERARRVACELHALRPRSDEAPEPADLNAIVEAALEMARSAAGPETRVEALFQPIPPVQCRRLQIVQLVFNLALNALQAVGEAGAVRIRTSRTENHARIEVSDDGPGVAAELRERIFEPLYTSDPDERAGLGLTICREIARSHGGSLEAGGDEGATFTLTLPLTEPILP